VPVRVVGKLSTEVTGGLYRRSQGASVASAGLLISPLEEFSLGDALNVGVNAIYPMGEDVGTVSSVETIDTWINLHSGVAYQVRMNASSRSDILWQIYRPQETIVGDFTAKAFVDPYFEIDPAYAALGYRLVFSEGINNVMPGSDPQPTPVPVPAAGWLLGAAILGLAGLRRRSERRGS
jgi:hypothetical protein